MTSTCDHLINHHLVMALTTNMSNVLRVRQRTAHLILLDLPKKKLGGSPNLCEEVTTNCVNFLLRERLV